MTNAANATDPVSQLAAHVDSFCDGLRAAAQGRAAVTSRRLIINAFIRSIASKRRAGRAAQKVDQSPLGK